ncbi:hypothetical protein VNO80_00973 [Phaseolus coccineus]|uniref:Uncharacterized protein n=1 Tax=Phaseolus coccineus TaxID=3886 RepID=A0AAN9NZI1_PHACN
MDSTNSTLASLLRQMKYMQKGSKDLIHCICTIQQTTHYYYVPFINFTLKNPPSPKEVSSTQKYPQTKSLYKSILKPPQIQGSPANQISILHLLQPTHLHCISPMNTFCAFIDKGRKYQHKNKHSNT